MREVTTILNSMSICGIQHQQYESKLQNFAQKIYILYFVFLDVHSGNVRSLSTHYLLLYVYCVSIDSLRNSEKLLLRKWKPQKKLLRVFAPFFELYVKLWKTFPEKCLTTYNILDFYVILKKKAKTLGFSFSKK